jgi:methenyltetrahydrofolate cyclohydrolase
VRGLDSSAPSLTDLPFRALVAAVAEQTPAPAGGSVAACGCALAAALIEMTAKFTRARDEYRTVHARMEEIDRRAGALRDAALELAEQELYAFDPVLAAMRLPREDPGRDARLSQARGEAAQPPLAVARVASEVAELGAELVRTGNRNLTGDAVTGALLAEGACRAAAELVAINLQPADGDLGGAEASELAARAARAREVALA